MARPLSAKLARRYYGPYEVLERVGSVAYRLRLPEGSRIHNVFHVSLLREFVAGDNFQQVDLPADFRGSQPIAEPLEFLESRTVLHGGTPVEQLLVRWSDNPATPTWETATSIRKSFPHIPLEGKLVLDAGGVDRRPTTPQDEEVVIEDDMGEQGSVARSLRPRDRLKQPIRFTNFVPK